MAHLNVELKARCAYPDETVRRLLELGAHDQGTDTQTDVYYQVPKGRLKVRHGQLENNLIHYLRSDAHEPKDAQVRMVAVDAERALPEVVDAALDRDVVVGKQRRILWLGNVKFHVDTVAELGSFLEVEAIDHDGTRARGALRAQCHEHMRLLGVDPADLEARSYSDMLRTGTR